MLDFVTLVWALLLIGGGYSWGYLFLRYGWPKIRILDDAYKLGWSVIFGNGFFAIVTILLITWFAIGGTLPAFVILAALCVGGFPVALLLLFTYRQFFTSRRVTVSASPQVITAHETADRLMEKVAVDQSIANEEFTRQQLEEIKRALAKALKEKESP